jgi:hypothetical protein
LKNGAQAETILQVAAYAKRFAVFPLAGFKSALF